MNRKHFFDEYRANLDPNLKLSQKEVDAIDEFLDHYENHESEFNKAEWAYIFATVFHETAHTFLPLKEAYWLSESWRKRNLRYYPYYGRGYVQLTWESNYNLMSKVVGKDLVNYPDLALNSIDSFKILIHGCKNGSFTGKALMIKEEFDQEKDLFNQFLKARNVINGRDKRYLIATYAMTFYKMLKVKTTSNNLKNNYPPLKHNKKSEYNTRFFNS